MTFLSNHLNVVKKKQALSWACLVSTLCHVHTKSNTTKQVCGQWIFNNRFNPILVSRGTSHPDRSGAMIFVTTKIYHNDWSNEQGQNRLARFMPHKLWRVSTCFLSQDQCAQHPFEWLWRKTQWFLAQHLTFPFRISIHWEPNPLWRCCASLRPSHCVLVWLSLRMCKA